MTAVSRQVRRAEERRATKPAPAPLAVTSYKRIGRRTKGMPYSRMVLDDVIVTPVGTPNIFALSHPTRKRAVKKLSATPDLVTTFFPSIPRDLAAFHLGA